MKKLIIGPSYNILGLLLAYYGLIHDIEGMANLLHAYIFIDFIIIIIIIYNGEEFKKKKIPYFKIPLVAYTNLVVKILIALLLLWHSWFFSCMIFAMSKFLYQVVKTEILVKQRDEHV